MWVDDAVVLVIDVLVPFLQDIIMCLVLVLCLGASESQSKASSSSPWRSGYIQASSWTRYKQWSTCNHQSESHPHT